MANVVTRIEKKLKAEPAWVWYVGAAGSIAAVIALAVAMHRNQATAGVAAAASAPGATGLGTSQSMAAPIAIPTSTTTSTVTDTTNAPISTVTTSTSSVDSHNFSQVFGNSGGIGGPTGGCDTCNAVSAAVGGSSPAPLTLEELQAKISSLGSEYALDTANHNPTAAMAAHQQAAILRDQGAMQGLGTLTQSTAGYDVLRTASGAVI